MIRCNKRGTNVNGDILTVTQEFVNVVIAVKDFLSDRMPVDVASRCLVTCVKIAYNVGNEEKENELCEELLDRFKEGYERRNEPRMS